MGARRLRAEVCTRGQSRHAKTACLVTKAATLRTSAHQCARGTAYRHTLRTRPHTQTRRWAGIAQHRPMRPAAGDHLQFSSMSALSVKSTTAYGGLRLPLWVVLCQMAPSDVRCRGHLLGAESNEMRASPAQKSARFATLWGQAWPSYGAQRSWDPPSRRPSASEAPSD